MAIIHKATLTPSKAELVASWLDHQPWAGAGDIETVGSYRFDDPAGEVGVEGIVVRRGDHVVHVPLTYRGAPLPGGDAHLVGTMRHSVLGDRWAYDAAGDPVAVACFVRALRGVQRQADMEVWDGDTLLERRDSGVRLRVEPGQGGPPPADSEAIEVDGGRLTLARVLGAGLDGNRRLLAEWTDGHGVVAAWSSS